MSNPTPGTKFYSVEFDRDRLPEIYIQWYVCKSGSWRRWRNIKTGREWNVNGMQDKFRNVTDAFLACVGYAGLEMWQNRDRLSPDRRAKIAKRIGDLYQLTEKAVAKK